MRTVNIHGFSFAVEPDPADYWDWIEKGTYHSDFETIKRFAGPNVTCIDAGAWIGADTLYASKMYKHVYVIEPDPVAFHILTNNLSANKPENVTLYQGALMDHAGMISIGSTVLGCSCTRESCQLNAVAVPCMTLREFCGGIPDPLFIKMDVEGAEAQILKDWGFFYERQPNLMLSTHLEWWKEAGSDGHAEYATISKVGRLYKNPVNSGGDRVDFNTQYGDVVFTNK